MSCLVLFAAGIPILKGKEALESEAQLPQAFYPIDSWPELDDFNTVLKFHTLDFERILPRFVADSFYELPDSKVAVSDHYVMWGEITDFLNNVAWRTGKDVRHLYTGTLAKTITRKCEKISLFESRYTYEVSAELALEPALLSLATMQRYVNWREGHYWRYGRLLDQKKGITDPDNAMVRYFKDHLLWPMIDLKATPIIDNLYDVVEKSTEVGTFGFSEDGNRIEKMNSDTSYCLATQEEISSWRGTQQPGKVWGITSSLTTNPAKCGAFDTATGEQVETQQEAEEEGYGLLALNTEKMKSDPNFQKKEDMLQSERARFEDFLEQDLLKAVYDRAAYEKEKTSNTGAVFSDGTNILMWGTGIGEVASLGFAAYQGGRELILLYCAKNFELLRSINVDLVWRLRLARFSNNSFQFFSKLLLKDEEKESYNIVRSGCYSTWEMTSAIRHPEGGLSATFESRQSQLQATHATGLRKASNRAGWWSLGGVIAAGFLEGLRNFSSTAY